MNARARIVGANSGKAIEYQKSQGKSLSASSSSKDTKDFPKKRAPVDSVVLDSAFSKVAKVDSEEKIDDDEEEGCFSSGPSSFFGANAWVS